MKTRNLVLTIAAASLAFGTSNLAADAEQPWHVTGAVGTVHFDQARNARENDVWWSVGFGRFFGNNVSIDVEYDQFTGTWRDYDTVAPGATYDKWKLSNWGLMGRYYFGEAEASQRFG